MWHLKTKLGVFWVIDGNEKCVLGVDDHELGVYSDVQSAVDDVHKQQTGYFKWDVQSRIKPPKDITQWTEGEPTAW